MNRDKNVWNNNIYRHWLIIKQYAGPQNLKYTMLVKSRPMSSYGERLLMI